MWLNPIKSAVRTIRSFLPLPWQLGRDFRRQYRFIQQSQVWETEKLQIFQLMQLKKIVAHAYDQVPYYRNLFDAHAIHPARIKDFSDFRRIPILTKDTVKDNIESLIAANIPRSQRIYLTTGGSTGSPMGFYRAPYSFRLTQAFHWRYYHWHGHDFGDPVAVLRSQVIENGLWKLDRATNALILSTHQLTEKNVAEYVQRLNHFRPKFILAYPSAIELMAQLINLHALKSEFKTSLSGIFTSSETLSPEQRRLLSKTLTCKIADLYGNSEMVSMFGTCEHGQYHDFMEYSYSEFLDEENNPVTGEGHSARLIGTTFVNPVMPLIRYETGDRVRVTCQKCACGRQLQSVQSIEGREKELIVTRTNDRIPLAPVIFGIHDHRWTWVRRIQFQQNEPGHLQILAESNHADAKELEFYLRQLFDQRLKNNFNFEIKIVERIPLTERGKFKYLVQRLPV